MQVKGWHMQREGEVVTLARRSPARFDLRVETLLPPVARLERLAHQVRQDMWRALRDLRGFAPVVRVQPCAGGVTVEAGGEVAGALPRKVVEARIAEVLEDRGNRARWVTWAA
ncbi:hypothetical protein [Alloyangia pacifica]|uniref:hypothetical protein n=1 Tax=Alloyangia pacifica TaxID=311180 RepID=UPI001CFE8A93|nr:hypothetical protein [Alloyangia pacifica]